MIMNSGAEPATKYMANDDFPEPPRRADSKHPIFIFAEFGSGSPPGPGGSVSVGLGGGGGRQLSPFWGGLARGLYRPCPPSPVESPPTPKIVRKRHVYACWAKIPVVSHGDGGNMRISCPWPGSELVGALNSGTNPGQL